jgi:hypothetical protein
MDYIFGSSGEDAVKGKKLQVKVGPSIETLKVAKVNNDSDPHFIDSPFFVGNVLVRIKDFKSPNPDGIMGNEEYFSGKKRMFALQFSGRFKHVYLRLTRNIPWTTYYLERNLKKRL